MSAQSLFYPRFAEAVTPHATNSNYYDILYIGVGGDVVVRPIDSTADVTYKNVLSGTYLYGIVTHVRASGTTATDIVGLRAEV